MNINVPEKAEPIACSLSGAALGDRERAWRLLLKRSLVHRQRVPGGVRLTVQTDSAATLKELVELELECCPWIRSELSGDTVTLTADGAGAQVLRALFACRRSWIDLPLVGGLNRTPIEISVGADQRSSAASAVLAAASAASAACSAADASSAAPRASSASRSA